MLRVLRSIVVGIRNGGCRLLPVIAYHHCLLYSPESTYSILPHGEASNTPSLHSSILNLLLQPLPLSHHYPTSVAVGSPYSTISSFATFIRINHIL
ncbi:hypothetical protein RIF29_03327 [Crotalaria pallida]|uniref:Uncharacterized protein n=1 Tax=Crotalaria pallida TaxID=3830 RepID=A0AAN9P985_CROPI